VSLTALIYKEKITLPKLIFFGAIIAGALLLRLAGA
jgi:multidrug transporter EmrE-like cation transporter